MSCSGSTLIETKRRSVAPHVTRRRRREVRADDENRLSRYTFHDGASHFRAGEPNAIRGRTDRAPLDSHNFSNATM